jgi:hypothetical protein
MQIYCTRHSCTQPVNSFADLDDSATLKTVQHKYCITCGMPLILDGRYLPLKLLGRGGFGAAFLARDRRTPTRRLCAVKQLQPPANLNLPQLEWVKKSFEREAEVLERLGSHPQIPELYAFFEQPAPGQPSNQPQEFFYLVQEYIDGLNLFEEMEGKGKFSEASVEEVLQEILKILHFVHDSGSIHRDIKPSNIMRNRHNGRLYLLDFGAVKQVTAGVSLQSSMVLGTPGFAPSEQMVGRQVYPSTDLYSLAVTCLYLLTGIQPADLYDTYNNRWNWRAHTQISERLGNILDRMLLPVPSQRFQEAVEVLEALNRVPDTGVSPPPPPPPPAPPTAPPPAPPTALPQPLPLSSPVLELLVGAAFTGFEGGLLLIALGSLLPPGISIGLWGMILGGLVYAQYRRMIHKTNLLTVAGITLAFVLLVPALRTWNPIQAGSPSPLVAVLLAILAGLLAMVLMALYRIFYKIIIRFL